MRKHALIAIALITLTGCNKGVADYFFPEKKEPMPTFKVEAQNEWWRNFNDPLMHAVAKQLLIQNLDMKIAYSRMREARAQERISRADWFPSINRVGNATRGTDSFGFVTPQSFARGGFDASWELDIFGRVRSAVSAAKNRANASELLVADMASSMLAELMQTVVEWRKARQTLKETQDLLTAEDDQVKLFTSRARAGLIDATFLERATAQRAQTATQLPLAQAAKENAQYKMERLLGKQPGALSEMLVDFDKTDLNVPDMQQLADTPLEYVKMRPDIKAARALFLAAQADVSAAEAALWPQISLGGFFGAQAAPSGLPFADNPIWSISAGLTTPVFQWGRLRGAVQAADERSMQAMLAYENTVLMAMQETKGALANFIGNSNAVTQQQKALKHRQDTVRLARERFKRGLTDMTDLTTAQAELDQATITLIDRKAQAASAYIALQKALGSAVIKKAETPMAVAKE